MVLLAFGIDHQTCPIHLREKMALDSSAANLALQELMSLGAEEALLLSTCNRTELYCGTEEPQALIRWLKKHPTILSERLHQFCYQLKGPQVVTHVMRVASGLESMVIGEAEILGQMKNAYSQAHQQGAIGKYLGRLFPHAFAVAKQVRTQTNIGHNPLSIGYAAAQLAQHIFDDISQATVLLVGAGDIARLTALHLTSAGVKHLYIVNRSLSRAQTVALSIQNAQDKMPALTLLDLSALPETLSKADIVITATGAALPLIGKGMVERAFKSRKHRPMFMVDLAVPRDIEPEVKHLPDVYLYCIDDLQAVVAQNRASRQSAALQAEQLILQGSEAFLGWLRAQEYFPILKTFRHKHEQMREDALLIAAKQLKAGQPAELVLQKMAHRLTSQFLHVPSVQLRQAGFDGDETMLGWLTKIYDLSD